MQEHVLAKAAMTLEQLKSDLVRYSHKLAARGWVANHDGNLSVRLPEDRFLITPTAMAKAEVDHSMLLIVDSSGKVLIGECKPFSEWDLHRAVYEARPDVQAIIHSHAPTATGFAVAGLGLERPVLPEAVVSLGRSIPLVPFCPPKSSEGARAVHDAAQGSDALLLENHGVLTFGPSLEVAYLRMELVEHQARIQLVAKQLGGPRYLSEEIVQPLLEARGKAGLGAPAESKQAPVDGALRAIIARVVAEELSGG